MNLLWGINEWVTAVTLFLAGILLLAGALLLLWTWDEKRLKDNTYPKGKNHDIREIDTGE